MTQKVRFEVEGWECVRCGHKWVPRVMTEIEPRICPKCKSPYWNIPRKMNASPEVAGIMQKYRKKGSREDK